MGRWSDIALYLSRRDQLVFCLLSPFTHRHFRLCSLLALGVGKVLLSVRGYQISISQLSKVIIRGPEPLMEATELYQQSIWDNSDICRLDPNIFFLVFEMRMSVTLFKEFLHVFPPKFKLMKLLDSTDFKFPTLKGLKTFAEALKSLGCSPL